MTSRSLASASLLLACGLLACTESTTVVAPFTGISAGGSTGFQASLSLTQVGDTARGGFTLRRLADSVTINSPSLNVPLRGDSLSFSFIPPAESGYESVSVRAQRRGDRIDAEVALDSTIVVFALERQ